tara:strand:+ start:318 stop:929 length:612 start_codon:yes stop_codon:yes gene_type:complete
MTDTVSPDLTLQGDPTEITSETSPDDVAAGSAAQADDALKSMDDLYMDDPLRSTLRRDKIESECEDMDVTDLLIKGYIEQDVPVRDGLVLAFRTLSGDQEQWLEHSFMDVRGTQRFLLNELSYTRAAAALVSINGTSFGDDAGAPVASSGSKAFMEIVDRRAKKLKSFPMILAEDITVQHAWFDARVRKLVGGVDMEEALGNT